MKKTILIFASIVMIAAFSNKTMAQNSATVLNTLASANILTPITLAEVTDLHFGTIVATVAGGTVNLSTTGVRTPTGVFLSTLAPTSHNASYHVTGTPTYTYDITLPPSITVTHATLPLTMTIDNLEALCASNSGTNGLTGTISGAGDDDFTVGGTITLGPLQNAGLYTGYFDVTVTYN